MKKFLSIHMLIALAVVFASCGTNNNVVNNRLISKRKFNKGFHINKGGGMKSSKSTKEEENLASDDSEKKKSWHLRNEVSESTNETTTLNQNLATTKVYDRSITTDANFQASDDYVSPVYDSESQINDSRQENVASSETKLSVDLKNQATEKNTKRKARAAASNSNLLNILLIVLLVLVIIALLSLLAGPLRWILSVVILVLIIYFLLRLLGVI